MLSYGQIRIALLQLYYKDQPIYNISFDMNITGHLDIKLFAKSLNYLLLRHPCLNLNIGIKDDKLYEKYNPAPIEIETYVGDHYETASNVFINRPFDIQTDKLLRVLYLEKVNQMVFLFSDIVIDGHTIINFFKELAIIYNALWSKTPPVFPLTLISDPPNDSLEFWRTILPRDRDLNLELKVKTQVDSFDEQRLNFQITSELFNLIRTKIKRLNLTLFDYFTSVFQLLLHLESGRDEIVIDTIFAKQNETRIGLFNDVILLPADFTFQKDQTMKQYFEKSAKVLLGIKTNLMPLETLCSSLKFKSLPNVRIHFEYSNKNTDKHFTFGNAKFESNLYENSSNKIRQLLIFNVCEFEDKIECYFSYRQACYDPTYIEHFKTKFLTLLETDDTCVLSSLSLKFAPQLELPVVFRPKIDKRLIGYTFAGRYPDVLYSEFKEALDNIV
jgi:hypothetical protein